MVKKIGILTSGGDAPGMNAAIRSLTRNALSMGLEVVGIKYGYKGLIEKDFIEFKRSTVSNLLSKGGTMLGTARLVEFVQDEVQNIAVKNLNEKGIDALCVIGGDGSYRGALALANKGIYCVGIPGTIDNDIPGTDQTIGFDTSLTTIVDCIDKLRDTSSSHHRCSVVEVMGNHCGDLALFSGLSTGAEIIITPETGYDENLIIEKLNYLEKLGKSHAIVVVSEKMVDVNHLANKISDLTGFAGRATVLGHIQRGGSPTAQDRILASRLAEKAIDLIINGVSGHCVGIKDGQIISLSIEEALKQEKKSRKELYYLFDKLV